MSGESPSSPTRVYRKRRRAEQEAQTRRRIVEAAVKLHGTIGPAHTTIKGIASEAGVQRATVYRHFPEMESLFTACSAHWSSLSPPPDPAAWRRIDDPEIRLRRGLRQLYAWYAWAEPMLINVFRDAPSVPAMTRAVEDFQRHFQALHQELMSGRRLRGRARVRVWSAIGHALAFATWHSLVREHELKPEEAVDLMVALVAAAPQRSAPKRCPNS